jgi:branched-chain amino acid transport system ATP-binding protein
MAASAAFHPASADGAAPPILGITGVSKSFGGVRALQDVSFDVHENTVTALIGPNGAGKTTLLNVISGIIRSDEGEVRFLGRPIGRFSPDRRARLGIVRTFQRVRTFPTLNVLENVLAFSWSQHIRRLDSVHVDKALDLLERFGLRRHAGSFPDTLSFADRRRVEIVRALMADPKLIMLDEPAAGMNPEEARELIHQLSRLRDDGVALLLIEHNMRVVMGLSNQIHVLNFGRRIASGTPAEVRSDKQVIAAYLGGSHD